MSAPAALTKRPPAAIGGPLSSGGLVLIAAPLFFIVVALANKFGIYELPPGARVAVLFLMLISVMLTGMPISIALGLTVLIFIFTMTKLQIDVVALKLFTGIEKFEIMAIPFFILAGNFLTHGGVARRMIAFATSLIGHWHGGLALAGVVSCAMFALVCGSSVATVVAIGSILLPEMVKAGYPMRFGAAVITVAGSLGILMLPSIPKVIYAVSTNTSIGALFVAGVLPGTLLTFMLCAVTWTMSRRNNYPRTPTIGGRTSARATLSAGKGLAYCLPILLMIPAFIIASLVEVMTGSALLLAGVTWLSRWVLALQGIWLPVSFILFKSGFNLGLRNEGLNVWQAYWGSIWGLLLVIIIVGGIYSGLFTATEAAAMAAVYSFFIAVFVYGDMKMAGVPKVLLRSANMSAMLLYIITNAVLFSFVLANENIPNALAEWLLSLNLGPVGFLLVVNLMLLIAGNFMEPSSIILIMAPILFPTAMKLGIDPVHFGILIDVNMEVGLCHPPVGLNLYVASTISGIGITQLTKSVMPWLIVMLLTAGNFMEPSSIILIMAPILFPTAMKLGIDPVHFGIMIDVNMEVGLCHPPVGLNLYVASTIAKLGITDLTKAVMPWLLTMLVFLVIVTYWPWLTLVVPQMLDMSPGHEPIIPVWFSGMAR